MSSPYQLTRLERDSVPGLTLLRQNFPDKYPFLLSTTSQSETSNTFDILFCSPKDYLYLDYQGNLMTSANYSKYQGMNFLEAFERIFSDEQRFFHQDEIPFCGGWFVYLSYEMAQDIEPCLSLAVEKRALPRAYLARTDRALLYDHLEKNFLLISEAGVSHQQVLKEVLADAGAVKACQRTQLQIHSELLEENSEKFLDAVKRVHQYIKDGDVFQVNLSRLWHTWLKGEHHSISHKIFQRLSVTNPAPFSGLVHMVHPLGTDTASIISSSPERLLSIKQGVVQSRPIAGTRPRSQSSDHDLELIKELHEHPKEQAEHIMLIDLIRNDLGRVSVPGSVQVNELMVNETYAHVHHIVSNVQGILAEHKSPVDAIRALFPGGTITGCPKVRCMEIIAELEKLQRNAYAGALGYFGFEGNHDSCIAIRTAMLSKGKIHLQAGAGIVADSVPENEFQETINKAKGMLKAIALAERIEQSSRPTP